MKRTSHVGLQLKLTVALVLIVMTPLAASYFLIDQIGKVAANFAAGEAGTHVVVMDKALEAYRDLIETTKRSMPRLPSAEQAARAGRARSQVDLDKIIDKEPASPRSRC